MDYNESVAYINALSEKKGVKRPLGDLKNILKTFGSPEDKLKIIHVAGTNGKGSTCAMLTSVLLEAGFRVGTFTSPHLSVYNERIRVDNEDISDADFAEQASAVKNAEENLSFFELLTLMAFNYFYEQKVDYAVIEVGLGGRVCPTNVASPLLSIITKIGFDHMNILGNTIEMIAADKAGIIKKNSTAVLYFNGPEVYNIVKEEAERQGAGLYYGGFDYKITKRSADETVFDVTSSHYGCEGARLKLIGDYQVYNASNLMLALHVLIKLGVVIRREHILNGLYKTRWPGRMELISKKPAILLDGAHNADGALELSKALDNYFPDEKIILVAGVLRGKEFEKILSAVSGRASRIILTKPDNRRALEPEELASFYGGGGVRPEIMPDCREAVERAVSLAEGGGMVCVTGSLYLVADVRKYLTEKGTVRT